MTVTIDFDPTQAGQFSDEIRLDTADGEQVGVGLAGTAGTPGHLQFSSEDVSFGGVQLRSTATRTFTVTNTGGTDVVINKSKPPFGGSFAALTSLQEGTTLTPGEAITETVSFTPAATGPAAAGSWAITGDDDTGAHLIQFTGTGVPVAGTPTTTTDGMPPPPVGSRPPAVTRHPPASPRAPVIAPRIATSATLAHTLVTYTALVAATSRFTVQRQTPGRRRHGGCVAVTARNRRTAHCLRWVTVARFTHRDRIGATTLRLTSMVAARRLTPGTYRVQSVLFDARGARHVFSVTLRVLP